jgi:hypothetical protein
MEESEVEDGDWRGVSLGEPTAVEGVEEAALRRRARRGTAVDAMGAIERDLGEGRLLEINWRWRRWERAGWRGWRS